MIVDRVVRVTIEIGWMVRHTVAPPTTDEANLVHPEDGLTTEAVRKDRHEVSIEGLTMTDLLAPVAERRNQSCCNPTLPARVARGLLHK
jgi:hypothetical protein